MSFAWRGIASVCSSTRKTRTGTPRRDILPEFGNRNSVHKRFCRRRDKGIGKTPADAAVGEPVGDIRMIDSAYIKAHAAHEAAGEDISRTKGCRTANCS
ncbi:hypothetical protein [Treponema endosymbiont of Eucomonympha sp.]|uniref:hypothetical protein n=1 Tax=Treponema endosymbiont of Eucomonympha sp. TaxID=1580831 RepID=UPI0007513D48|nr:hypothetical protein [Treponema endosymbiont of Eucomonympha sp.]